MKNLPPQDKISDFSMSRCRSQHPGGSRTDLLPLAKQLIAFSSRRRQKETEKGQVNGTISVHITTAVCPKSSLILGRALCHWLAVMFHNADDTRNKKVSNKKHLSKKFKYSNRIIYHNFYRQLQFLIHSKLKIIINNSCEYHKTNSCILFIN